MPAFVDTSIILARLFNQVPQLSDQDWNSIDNPYASELVRVESYRVIERQKLDSAWSDRLFADSITALETLLTGFTLVPLDPLILSRACQPFGIRLRTLDALHLSTVLLLRNQDPNPAWILYTHDDQLKHAARACGLRVQG